MSNVAMYLGTTIGGRSEPETGSRGSTSAFACCVTQVRRSSPQSRNARTHSNGGSGSAVQHATREAKLRSTLLMNMFFGLSQAVSWKGGIANRDDVSQTRHRRTSAISWALCCHIMLQCYMNSLAETPDRCVSVLFYILCTGERPSNCMPLLSTILAASYIAIRATFFSGLSAYMTLSVLALLLFLSIAS